MKFIVLLCLFLGLYVLDLTAAEPCPLCGGELTTVGKVVDDPSKPNKNTRVWRMSKDCGLAQFRDDSPICKQCWFATDSGSPPWRWRGSEDPNSFFFPLSATIRKFPTPAGNTNYEQHFNDDKRTDGLFFRCENSPELIAKFRAYCTAHNLQIMVVEFTEDVGIWVNTPETKQSDTDQPATHPESKSEDDDKTQPESEGR